MSDMVRFPPGHVVPRADRDPVVTEWSGYDDWYSAPPDYDAFARQYMSYTRVLCLRFGVRKCDVEDVVSMLILRFFERHSLAVFDSGAVTRGERAKFRSFYSRAIHTYCMGKKRNSILLEQRQPLVFDEPVGSEESSPTIGEVLCSSGGGGDPLEEVECTLLLDELRAALPASVSRMVDALVLLSRTQSQPPGPTALAEVLGCSLPEARSGLRKVRQVASVLFGRSLAL